MKTLRNKVTLIVSILLLGTMGLLTAYSIFNSNMQFVTPIMEAAKMSVRLIDVDAVNTTAPLLLERVERVDGSMAATAITFDAGQAQQTFGLTQLVFMLVIVIGGVLLTRYLMGQALKPLDTLNKATAQINAHRLSTQIAVSDSQDEIAALTNSFNSMLVRLNKAFELQKNFAQNAAHELKTPLAVIKSSLQVLTLDETPTLEDYRETTQVVTESTDELIEIVSQLLMLTEKVEPQVQEIQTDQLIQECVREQHALIEEMNLTLTITGAGCVLYANAQLVKRVLSNILSNAAKYNRQDGTIEINTRLDGDSVGIRIQDTGIGIGKEDLGHVFDPFFRADESRSKQTGGNGLGLAIVKAMVEKLEGELSIESSQGTGTQVTVRLPLEASSS